MYVNTIKSFKILLLFIVITFVIIKFLQKKKKKITFLLDKYNKMYYTISIIINNIYGGCYEKGINFIISFSYFGMFPK